jgi:predicted dehydrogenase
MQNVPAAAKIEKGKAMKFTTRRGFLTTSAAAGFALGFPALARSGSPNNEIRIAIIGLGAIDIPGGVGGRGRQLITRIRRIPGAKIVALCDVDETALEREAQQFKTRGENITTHRDFRRVLDDKTIDAVFLATPNHWHALGTILACEAGKDVYVEKPFCHNIWEGRQMVAAARRHQRMVQVGTHRRSSTVMPEVFAYLRSGQLGRIQFAHALVYRARAGIGRVDAPTRVPATVDYDLWCGPAPKVPLKRRHLHYEWHWDWATGNGEMGNNGVHVIDVCRWGLDQNQPPPRAMSIGGRFAYNDAGETPNTQIAFFDYQPAPIVCEIRNVSKDSGPKATDTLGQFRGRNRGVVIVCEGGYFAGEFTDGTLFDRTGRVIREFQDKRKSAEIDSSHPANFLAAVRSRKTADLAAGAWDGYVSAACCHMANISHRLGRQSTPAAILEKTRGTKAMMDAFGRCRENLRENRVDLEAAPAVLGPWVTFDAKQERFVGDFADEANRMSKRDDRAPFIVPQLA